MIHALANSVLKKAALLMGVLMVLGIFPCAVLAEEETCAQLLSCEITGSSDTITTKAYRLQDGNADSRISLSAGDQVTFLQTEPAGFVYLTFYEVPDTYTVISLDAMGNELSRETVSDGLYQKVLTLQENSCGCRIIADNALILSDVCLYGNGTLPDSVPQWSTDAEDGMVLLIVSRPEELFTAYGGFLPLVLNRGVDVRVIIMQQMTAERRDEACRACWALGMTHEPVVAGFSGRGGTDYSTLTGKTEWGNATKGAQIVAPLIASAGCEVVVSYSN